LFPVHAVINIGVRATAPCRPAAASRSLNDGGYGVQLPWYVTALGAAVVWGIHYPLVDNALKKVSLFSVLLLTALPILLVSVVYVRQLQLDYAALRALAPGAQLTVLSLALTSLLGTVLLYVSIGGKNATLASLIEISYPVFVAVFAWVLFRELHVNASVLLGAALVFAGVGLIIFNNPH
jgi:drug/metabolite transporter (DMT)-like permease